MPGGLAIPDHPPPSPWLRDLDEDDLQFIKRFILASGSLKELALAYGVSYPTLRARLDRLISKVRIADDAQPQDPLERKLRLLVADGKIGPGLAKELLAAHRSPQKNSSR